MNNNLTVLHNSQTMSSLAIAELTEKNHSDVLRDIKVTLSQAEIGASKFADTYKSKQNKDLPCYNLPRRECDLVISGYSVPYRLAIIDRWHELESKRPKPTALELARKQVLLLEHLEEIEQEKKFLEVTLDFEASWASIKYMELKYKKQFAWQALKAYSLNNDFEIKRVFDQNYGTVNSYHIDVWLAVYGVGR